jgi:Domain of unknown function (DUF4352)
MAEKKKPIYKRWWFWVIAVIIVAGVAGSFEDGDESENQATKSTKEAVASVDESADGAEEEEKQAEEENKVNTVGDAVEIDDGAMLTLTSARYTNAQDYIPAENGKVLAIEFELVNNGEDRVYFGAEELSISTPDGTQYDKYFGGDNVFINENVNAGKKITGVVYFDVPETETYEIIYTPNFSLDNKTISFEVSPE